MENPVARETRSITSVDDLRDCILHFESKYGMKQPNITFSDGLPLTSITYISQTWEDGTKTTELVLSDD